MITASTFSIANSVASKLRLRCFDRMSTRRCLGVRSFETALAFFRLAEFGDYCEVFEGGGVAFDFAVGG
jgi:hypothetical protein